VARAGCSQLVRLSVYVVSRVCVFVAAMTDNTQTHTHTHTSSTSSSSPAEAAAAASPLSRHLHDRGMHTLTYTPLTSRLTGRGTHFSTFTRYTSIHDDPFQGVTCSPRLRCSLIMYRRIGRYQRSKHRKSVASLNTTRRLLCMLISSYGRHVVQKKLGFRAVVKVRGARGLSPPCFDYGGVWPPARI